MRTLGSEGSRRGRRPGLGRWPSLPGMRWLTGLRSSIRACCAILRTAPSACLILLVRSDVLGRVVPRCYSHLTRRLLPRPISDIGDRHYIVVDIKYTTLSLTASGWRARSIRVPLCRVQGAAACLQPGAGQAAGLPRRLGRSCWAAGWKQKIRRGARGPGRQLYETALAPVEHDEVIPGGSLSRRTDDAAD